MLSALLRKLGAVGLRMINRSHSNTLAKTALLAFRMGGRPFGPLLLICAGALALAACLPFPVMSADGPPALSQPLTQRWQYASEQTTNLTPATDGEQIYLPLTEGSLISLQANNGRLRWRAEIGGEFSAAPLADARGVYVASETRRTASGQAHQMAGSLYALSRATGITMWMRTLGAPLRGAMASDGRTIFAGSADGRIYAFRQETGEIIWHFQHSAAFASHPVLRGSRLYVGSEDGVLFALDQATGRPLWRYQTRGALRGAVSLAQQMVFFGSADGNVYALYEANGVLRWRARTGAGVQAVAYVGGGVVVASLDNFVYFLSPQRGDRLWKRQLAGRIAAQPLVGADGVLFAPLSGDVCVVLDPRDGRPLNLLPVGEDNNTAASPVRAGDVVLVTTRQGLLAFGSPTASVAR